MSSIFLTKKLHFLNGENIQNKNGIDIVVLSREIKSIWHDKPQAGVVPMPEMIVDWVYNKKDKQ